MKTKLILTLLIISLFSLSFISAGCTQSGVPGEYSIGENVVATINCGASDKGDIINYTWYNQSGSFLEQDILTIPQTSPFIVFASWTVTSGHAPNNNSRTNFIKIIIRTLLV